MAVKKASILLCCAAALTVCAALVLNWNGFRRQGKIIPASSASSSFNNSNSIKASSQGNSTAAATLASGSDLYIVKEYEGHIGVYRNNEKTPFRQYGTDVTVLPKADRTALKQGKVLHSMAEVEKLGEDSAG